MRIRPLLTSLAVALLVVTTAAAAFAADVFVNGVKVQDLKNADLSNCTVKFDAAGNVHVIAPGYRVVTDKDGRTRVVGSSDFADVKDPTLGKLKSKYVLMYQPNPKVNFQFEVSVNGELFKKIGLDDGPFGVELTQKLKPGNNTVRVVGKPAESPPGGTESDVAMLRIFRGEERSDGTFVAKQPAVWEFVRAAVDREAYDRTYTVVAE